MLGCSTERLGHHEILAPDRVVFCCVVGVAQGAIFSLGGASAAHFAGAGTDGQVRALRC